MSVNLVLCIGQSWRKRGKKTVFTTIVGNENLIKTIAEVCALTFYDGTPKEVEYFKESLTQLFSKREKITTKLSNTEFEFEVFPARVSPPEESKIVTLGKLIERPSSDDEVVHNAILLLGEDPFKMGLQIHAAMIKISSKEGTMKCALIRLPDEYLIMRTHKILQTNKGVLIDLNTPHSVKTTVTRDKIQINITLADYSKEDINQLEQLLLSLPVRDYPPIFEALDIVKDINPEDYSEAFSHYTIVLTKTGIKNGFYPRDLSPPPLIDHAVPPALAEKFVKAIKTLKQKKAMYRVTTGLERDQLIRAYSINVWIRRKGTVEVQYFSERDECLAKAIKKVFKEGN